MAQDGVSGKETEEWQYDGVFVFIGLMPNGDLVKEKVETNEMVGFRVTDKPFDDLAARPFLQPATCGRARPSRPPRPWARARPPRS